VKSTSHYGRVVVKFIVQALSGKPLTVYGNGMQTRSFCYITDLIEGLFKLLLIPGIDGETVNLGSNEEISILSLAKIISELTGADSGTVFKPLPEDDPMRRNPEISKAEKLLGWKPKVSLKEGLEKTIDWISSLI
jgi:nucleoside-diphosphate-sugar epimerase